MKKGNWRKYVYEFICIFIAVISAFALNNWNENRRDRNAEAKILTEIKNGLQKDIEDIQLNMRGHQSGMKACTYWRKLIQGEKVALDSFYQNYFNLTRDFITIKNSSGYESLKSRGLNLIANDSLRFEIISFYEYDLSIVEKFEEEYAEMQFQKSYYNTINNIVAPYFFFDENGQIGIQSPLRLSTTEKNILLSNIWKIQVNRNFILDYYAQVENRITQIISHIEEELNK